MGVKYLFLLLVFVILASGCSSQNSGSVSIESPSAPTESPQDTGRGSAGVENKEEPVNTSIAAEQTEKNEQQEAEAKIIMIERGRFEPSSINISKGEAVLWKNNDLKSSIHIVMIYREEGGVIGPHMELGDEYKYTFNERGEFIYIDLIFKEMRGKVIVE